MPTYFEFKSKYETKYDQLIWNKPGIHKLARYIGAINEIEIAAYLHDTYILSCLKRDGCPFELDTIAYFWNLK